MNEDGTAEVPLGEHGEIWAKGPNVMKGYWRNEKATNEILTKDGWLMTGDIGYVDQHEKFFIVDRKKVYFQNSSKRRMTNIRRNLSRSKDFR